MSNRSTAPRTIRCPTCGSPKGRHCRSINGRLRYVEYIHRARVKRWELNLYGSLASAFQLEAHHPTAPAPHVVELRPGELAGVNHDGRLFKVTCTKRLSEHAFIELQHIMGIQ